MPRRSRQCTSAASAFPTVSRPFGKQEARSGPLAGGKRKKLHKSSCAPRLPEYIPPTSGGHPPRRTGGRVVEGARLERVYTGNRIEGSNPSLSAIPFKMPAPRSCPGGIFAFCSWVAWRGGAVAAGPGGRKAVSQGRYSPHLMTARMLSIDCNHLELPRYTPDNWMLRSRARSARWNSH